MVMLWFVQGKPAVIHDVAHKNARIFFVLVLAQQELVITGGKDYFLRAWKVDMRGGKTTLKWEFNNSSDITSTVNCCVVSESLQRLVFGTLTDGLYCLNFQVRQQVDL